MINDHLCEGRFTLRVGSKRISKNVYAKTREECEEKLAELIKTMKSEIAEIKNKRKTHNAQRGDHEWSPHEICVGGNKEKPNRLKKFIEI